MINHFFAGAIMMGSFTASLYFLKFWKLSRDSFFAYFSFGLALLGVERILFEIVDSSNPARPFVFLVRSSSYLVIIWAVISKNYGARRSNARSMSHI